MTVFVVDRIQVPSSTVAGETPPATLQHGELWVNTADALIFAGVDGSAPIQISGGGSGLASGDAGVYV